MSDDPSQFNLTSYLLGADQLSQFSENTAIEFQDRRLTYGELRAEVERWVRRLENRGVSEGDRVAILLYDSPEFIACFLAVASLGAICVPINTFLSGGDVAFILGDSGARLLIAENDLQDKSRSTSGTATTHTILVDTLSRAVCRDDFDDGATVHVPSNAKPATTTRQTPAFLLYTSGSTGTPKGVLHRHGSIPFTIKATQLVCSSSLRKIESSHRRGCSSLMDWAIACRFHWRPAPRFCLNRSE